MGVLGGRAQGDTIDVRRTQLQHAIVLGCRFAGGRFGGMGGGGKAQQSGRKGQRQGAQGKTKTRSNWVRHGDPFVSNRSVSERLLRVNRTKNAKGNCRVKKIEVLISEPDPVARATVRWTPRARSRTADHRYAPEPPPTALSS